MNNNLKGLNYLYSIIYVSYNNHIYMIPFDFRYTNNPLNFYEFLKKNYMFNIYDNFDDNKKYILIKNEYKSFPNNLNNYYDILKYFNIIPLNINQNEYNNIINIIPFLQNY